MTMLVSLEEAKAQIRQTQDHEDEHIVLQIHAASAAVLAYLKSYDFVDSDGEAVAEEVPYQVKAATLILVAMLFRDRDGPASIVESSWDQDGYLPRPVVALLYPLRDPAMA